MLSPEKQRELIVTLKTRFEKNGHRHSDVEWADVETRLELKSSAKRLKSLSEMEQTGGEPDVIGVDEATGEFLFCDCSAESPKGRRSLCYDREALEARKANKPQNSALSVASDMGIELLDEEQYRQLQQLESFDLKTSSWIKTPPEIRKHGGALFCDRRYDHVFVYHNGADSYYASRGFRGLLRV